jgi:hypothetical protein
MRVLGSLRGGRIIWSLAELNGDATMDLGHGDVVKGYIMMATSHDGSVRTIGKATQIAVYGQTTLSATFSEAFSKRTTRLTHAEMAKVGVFMMKHTKKFDDKMVKEAKAIMDASIEQIRILNKIAKRLSKISVTQAEKEQFVAELMTKGDYESSPEANKGIKRLGKRILEAIDVAPGAQLPTRLNTLWGCICGVTWFEDTQRGEDDYRLYASWFGGADARKLKAIKLALAIANAKAPEKIAAVA